MKIRTLWLIGLLVFAGTLVLSTPVALLLPQLAKRPNAPQLAGAAGTVSEGTAAALVSNGRPVLKNLHWRFRPIELLLARVAYAVDASGELSLSGTVARSPAALRLDGLRVAGDLRPLLALANGFVLPVAGQFGLDVANASVVDNWPKQLNGELKLEGLRWTLAAHPLVLGDFVAHLETQDKLIVAKLATVSGAVDVGGEIRLNPDRSADVDLQLKARPGADPLIVNLVGSMGQPDTQGYFHFKAHQTL